MLKTSIFYIICINYNKEQYGGWKPSILLKLYFLESHVVYAKLVMAISHSILQKI
jgi:hypothetical protein